MVCHSINHHKTSLSYHEIPQKDHEIMIESSLKSHQIMIFGPRAFSKIRTSSGAPGSWKSTWINVGGDWDLDGLSGISWGFMWFIHIYIYISHYPSIQVSSGDVSLHSGVKFGLTQQQSNCMHFSWFLQHSRALSLHSTVWKAEQSCTM